MIEDLLFQKTIQYFHKVVDSPYVVTDAHGLATWGHDWTRGFKPAPSLAVLPQNVSQVQSILQWCHTHAIAVVPSGGQTGLAGGATAEKGEIVLSLKRMNKIITKDPTGLLIEAEAGVTTQDLQEAADHMGLLYPIDLASKGSSQLGGNIATNAGGLKFIRYGGMREQVIGLEVVLADGSLLDLNRALRKDNCGYDLKHMFIGSEGTLGVITKATVRLLPKPQFQQLGLMAVNAFEDVLRVLAHAHKVKGLCLNACEFFTKESHLVVAKYFPQLIHPFEVLPHFFMLIEADCSEDLFTQWLEALWTEGMVADAVLASSGQQFTQFWNMRECITESIAQRGYVHKNDITLPIRMLNSFYEDLTPLMRSSQKTEGIDLLLFGHVGDGNIHINYSALKTTMSVETFQDKVSGLEKKIFAILHRYAGSISAEHGIGLLKKKDLHLSRSPQAIHWMQTLKMAFDPKGILNPGKIFDLHP